MTAPLLKPSRLERRCGVCGGLVPPKVPKWQKTCSAKCGYEQRKRKTWADRPQRNCDWCQKLYQPLGTIRLKFCSLKCRHAHAGQRLKMLPMTCPQCGASFKRTAAAVKRTQRSFCSSGCSSLFYSGEKAPMFRGHRSGYRGPRWHALAESIRVRDGYACRRCGITQADNRQKLSVDHMRAWREFENKDEANHPDNLVSLCRVCHAYKTSVVERKWLQRGDLVGLNRFRRECGVIGDAHPSVRKWVQPPSPASQKTHCKHGHPLSGDNLALTSHGKRRCLTCHKAGCRKRAKSALYKAKRNAKLRILRAAMRGVNNLQLEFA